MRIGWIGLAVLSGLLGGLLLALLPAGWYWTAPIAYGLGYGLGWLAGRAAQRQEQSP